MGNFRNIVFGDSYRHDIRLLCEVEGHEKSRWVIAFFFPPPRADPSILASCQGRLHRKIFSPLLARPHRGFRADPGPTLPHPFRRFGAENAAGHAAEISGNFRRNFLEKIFKK